MDSNFIFSKIVLLIVVVTSLPMHEFAHAYVAHKMGDDTAKWQGRLTLNPVVHLDVMGTLMLLFAGVGWAKPVPINPRNFKNPKMGMAISSLAGPASNILLALVLLIIYKALIIAGFFNAGGITMALMTILTVMITSNIYLAVFNLLPIPPLDGSRIATYFLPTKYYFKIMQYEQIIWFGLIALLIIGVFDAPLAFASSWILRGLDTLTFFLGSVT